MKRMTYVDNNGNTTDIAFESKKPILYVLLGLNIAIPIILISLIIYRMSVNNTCTKVYENIKRATKAYSEELGEQPSIEGESTIINIGDLYSEQYLKISDTDSNRCSGTVKITKYENSYVYTVDTSNCNKCDTNQLYSGWSTLQKRYPSGKMVVDVIPYYNYCDLQFNTTKWTAYYDEADLSDELSEYGIKLPLDKEKLPTIPVEAEISNIESESTYYYRYRDKKWKWYDQELDYSDFASEMPEGYSKKDKDISITTAWSDYSQNYPGEKSYRKIEQKTGYKFYYLNDKNEKVYYDNGNYAAESEVNTKKYNKKEKETAILYRYQDQKWRWYNGQKRKYSTYSTKGTSRTPLKDAQTEIVSEPDKWTSERKISETSEDYRLEEKKIMTRFRIKYEFSTQKVLKKDLTKEKFEEKLNQSIKEIAGDEEKKLTVDYKFRYRK